MACAGAGSQTLLLTVSCVSWGPSFPDDTGRHGGGSHSPKVTQQGRGPWGSLVLHPMLAASLVSGRPWISSSPPGSHLQTRSLWSGLGRFL